MPPDDAQATKPYAAWASIGLGLAALAAALFALLSGNFEELMEATPNDHPWLLAALVQGIAGTVAGVIALARREPRRLVLMGLAVSVTAIVTKFFLLALMVGVAALLTIFVLVSFFSE